MPLDREARGAIHFWFVTVPITLLIIFVVIALIAGAIYAEVSFWNECRESHSWLYCFRILGGK